MVCHCSWVTRQCCYLARQVGCCLNTLYRQVRKCRSQRAQAGSATLAGGCTPQLPACGSRCRSNTLNSINHGAANVGQVQIALAAARVHNTALAIVMAHAVLLGALLLSSLQDVPGTCTQAPVVFWLQFPVLRHVVLMVPCNPPPTHTAVQTEFSGKPLQAAGHPEVLAGVGGRLVLKQPDDECSHHTRNHNANKTQRSALCHCEGLL